jgi:hypothetical protein
MVAWILVGTTLASFGSAVVYNVVGLSLYRRPVSAGSRLALAQFTAWWCGLGLTVALTGLEAALSAAGDLSLSVAVTVSLISLLLDCVFLWALVDYLVYLYTGRYHFVLVAGFYGLFYVAALYYTILEHPYGLVVRAGVPTLQVMPVTNHLLVLIVVSGLLFPEFIAAFLYLSLLRRTQDRSRRFRITVVSLSIIAWFGLEFFFPTATAGETLLRGLLQLIPALLTLMAYFPPGGIRRRFRISGIEISSESGISTAPSAQ